jgi:hypothetical protein
MPLRQPGGARPEGVLGRPSEALRPRSARRGKAYASPQQRAMPRRRRPTQPPTRPTASRTGRRRPGDPRDLLTSRLRDGNGRHGPEVHLVRTVANPRPTAPNEHRVWEPNVDNISWPDDAVLPICSHYDARAANSRSFKDQQSTPYTGFDLRKSSSANEVTEVELRGFEPLTL